MDGGQVRNEVPCTLQVVNMADGCKGLSSSQSTDGREGARRGMGRPRSGVDAGGRMRRAGGKCARTDDERQQRGAEVRQCLSERDRDSGIAGSDLRADGGEGQWQGGG